MGKPKNKKPQGSKPQGKKESGKKESGNKLSRLEKVLLATAAINLIKSIIDLVKSMLGWSKSPNRRGFPSEEDILIITQRLARCQEGWILWLFLILSR